MCLPGDCISPPGLLLYRNPRKSASPVQISMKAIFFDAAGTLISVAEPVGETYCRIAVRHGVTTTPEVAGRAFRSAWKSLPQPQHDGRPAPDDDRGWWHELVRRCFTEATGGDLPQAVLGPLFDDLYSHYAHPAAWTVFPDVLPALSALHGRWRLFVLSNFDRRLRDILAGHGLTRFFDSLIISSEVGASKPDGRIFAHAAGLAACRPDECLHIGDDEHFDLEGARAAGFAARLAQRPGRGLESIVREVLNAAVL